MEFMQHDNNPLYKILGYNLIIFIDSPIKLNGNKKSV